MSKNNPLRKMTPKQQNYRLYKAKKQWVTACATFLLTFGATAAITTNVHADTKKSTVTPVEEVSLDSASSANGEAPTQSATSHDQTNSQAGENKQPITENKPSAAGSLNSPVHQTATTDSMTPANAAQPVVDQSQANTDKQSEKQKAKETVTTANAANPNPAKITVQADPKALAASKAAENITPVAYSGTYVLPGTNLTNDAAKFIANAKELEKAGAKISWQTMPEIPATYNGDMYNGTVLVTYANGTTATVDVTDISLEGTLVLNPKQYYYVPEVNDKASDLNIPDANGNSLSTILNNGYVLDSTAITYKLSAPLDTSEEGIHWAAVQVTDHSQTVPAAGDLPASYVIGGPYTVKIPYLVKGLKVRDDIPKDASGNPVINAQLATGPLTNSNTQIAFDPSAMINNHTFGEYFYQDYALAYALGIQASFTDWTNPTDLATAKNNHFTITLSGVPNADKQEVEVNYVANPTSDPIYIFNSNYRGYQNPGYIQNTNKVKELAKDGFLTKGVHIELPDGTSISPSDISINNVLPTGGTRSGKFTTQYTVTLNPLLNKAGQPLIWSNAMLNNNGETASANFANEVNHWYQVTNNTNDASFASLGSDTWLNNTNAVTILAPTVKNSDNDTLDLTNKTVPYVYDNTSLSTLVANPKNAAAVKKDYPGWVATNKPNQLPDGKWPEGTTFEWLAQVDKDKDKYADTPTKLTFDTAGQSKTGAVKITLPSGSSWTVKDITITSKANVTTESKTIDYGTKLTAKDLVTNTKAFPEGTTFQFVNGTEPTWNQARSYNNVQITATYPNPDKDAKPITTPISTCAVAINDTCNITVLEGSTTPSIDSVLNFDSGWAAHTANWTKDINTNSTNQGEITVHYPSSKDQVIKVLVTVIPKQTVISGEEFHTNGTKYDGTAGSIANGTENQGAVLINNGGQAVSYDTYNKGGEDGKQSTFTQTSTTYTPSYSLTGLQTNSDGSLVSGPQNVTVRISVPKGTIGAQVDKNGNYYYDVTTNIVVAQPVTFEFVDVYNNNEVIGKTHTQEFIPGQDTKLNFAMPLPAGKEGVYSYVLANGATIPTSYTLKEFTDTPITVKVGVHQSMHFTIKVHDETDNKDIGSVVVPSANAQNGGFDPNFESQLQSQLPNGVTTDDYESVSVSGVPEGATFTGNYRKSLTDAATEWWVPNYVWDNTSVVEKALTGATITINVKHKIQTTTEQQTRTATVNYVKAKVNADGTYTKDGNAFDSAVLDVYYSRTKTEDLVTKKPTYTPWLWDTTQGNHGYRVVSGTWTNLPQEWGAVTAKVPTLAGYTVAVVTDKSGKPANEFVYPTWNGEETDSKQASLAYTKDATAYEAQPVHTVLYIPVETEARTITAKFVIAGGDKDGQNFAPEAQAQIFYDRTGSLNVNNNTITYGDWQWDKQAGDSTTPGFKVLSGSWSLTKQANNTWSVNPPAASAGYTMVTINGPASYTTETLAAPNFYPNTAFTSPTADQWYMRNQLITYYVPNSLLNKNVTRTITITEPGKDSTTLATQTVALTRPVKVNSDDTGVVYDGFTGSGWNTGNWDAVNVPTNAGYTISVTQTVNGKTTPIELVNGQIPAAVVNGASQNTTINITYGALATAKLAGNGSSTYNGQAITNTDLNNGLHVTITGPTAGAGTYTLQSGDVEFSTDGTNWTTTMPTNAGKYQIRLTSQGERGIIDQFGNNSIVWDHNGTSTITSAATWTINKLASDAVMANAQTGNYEMTYNGAAPSTIDPGKFVFTTTVNGQTVTLKSDNLTSADFSWVNGSAPVNVGTYQVKLNAQGLAKLQAANPNFTLKNTGNGSFTINQASASAVLSGSGTRAYNGQAVAVDEVNSDGTITLTLHYPKNGDANYSTTVKLNAGDFVWNTPDGQAPVNASETPYTISLNNDAIQKIIEQAVGTGQNGVSNVKFTDGAISGSASYTITPLNTDAVLANTEEGNYSKVYDAEVTNQIDPAKFQITATVNGRPVTLNATGLTGGSYEWVDADGHALTASPKNVGTYYVKLTDAAFAKLQANNPNFTLTNTGLGVYTITPAQATAALTGSNTKVYDGTAITLAQVNSNGEIKVNLNFPGATGQTYALKQGDYTISGNATDAGSYTISLTAAGIANVENAIKSFAGTGQDGQNNVEFATDAVTGTASFTITPSANVLSVGGTQTETYNGAAHNVAYNAAGTNSVTVSIAKASGNQAGSLASLTNVPLASGDFVITDGPAKKAGSYQVALTAAGLAKIKAALGKNYTVTASAATGALQIDKYLASAVFSGDLTKTYDGSPISDYLGKYTISLDEPNHPTYTLQAGDLEFKVNGEWTTEAPANVGRYEVRLSQQGWNNIKAINSANVTWAATASAGEGSYTITQAQVTAALSGSNSRVYNGSPVTTTDLYTPGSTITVTIAGDGIANLPRTFTLADGDYQWQTTGNQAPQAVGTYTIKLTTAGINKIQNLINQAVGAGNVALITTAANAGSASFSIKQAVASNVQLYGHEESTFNNHPVSLDPRNGETKKNYGFNNVAGLTIPAFTSADFGWYDADGNAISAPTNVGTYYLELNDQGKAAFAAANPNYTFEDQGQSTISGRIAYVINPAELVIGVSGSASKVYDSQNAQITQDQIDSGQIKLVWENSENEPAGLGQFTLTPADLEVVDVNGNAVETANAGYGPDGKEIMGTPYRVRLTAAAIEKIKQLSGATNYAISQSTASGKYYIYEHKAELTLTGNQTTVYGTALPFDPSSYTLKFTDWVDAGPTPVLTWRNGRLYNHNQATNIVWNAGDLYVTGYPDGGVPTNVGTYPVKISQSLIDKLRQLFPNYDFSGNIGQNNITLQSADDHPAVEGSHTPASYVVTPAATTVTINGAEHVKYGDPTSINYGRDNGYTLSITAPVHNGSVDNTAQQIYPDVTLGAGDLEFVTSPTNVGTYQVKLSAQGLRKLQALTGSANYDWTQATSARATFYVNQMPATIAVNGDSSVTYGSAGWLSAISAQPSGYTITITTENGATLDYTAQAGDLVFSQTPGNVGTYQVVLSAQGLTNIERALGTNYAYPQTATNVAAHGTFEVKQGQATVTLNGSDGKIYDAEQTLPANLDLSKYHVEATVYSPTGQPQSLTLTSDDLQIIGNATNAGTYQVALSPVGQEKLEQLTGNNGTNYKWTFDSDATYKITAASAQAVLVGTNEKTFDGQPVTTAEVNSNGQILVHLTFPGSTSQSTYTLQDGDYTWVDGAAPTKVGTYQIKLNKDEILRHLQDRLTTLSGEDNVAINAADLSGQATFKITPKEIASVTIAGNDQEKTYNGQGAALDVSGLTITADGTVANTPLINAGITADDFNWYDANGQQLTSVPTDVGTYQVRIKPRVLQALQEANPDYHLDAVNGVINYTIDPAPAAITIGGAGERTYSGRETPIADVVNNVSWTPTGLVAGQALNLTGISADSYVWYSKDAQGNLVPITGNPINVGTYYLQLSDGAIAQIKRDNPNYQFTSITGKYTYTINVASGTAALSGANSKIYDGQPVSTAEIDSPDGNITVHFTFPGSNTQSTYALQAGDYVWVNGEEPVNAGTYTLKLSDQGLAHLQAAVDAYAGPGNVIVNADSLTGTASFTIGKRPLDVTLTSRQTVGKTYDGQPGAIDLGQVVLSPQGLVTGERLNTTGLTADDYEFFDASGKPIAAPVNAGTYHTALTSAGLAKLQADNPNYQITEHGQFEYVITPMQVQVTLSGHQESSRPEIDSNDFNLSAPAGVVVPAGITYTFASGTPQQAGTYRVGLTPASQAALEAANPNYQLTISSDADFTLDATVKIIFEDTDHGNQEVGTPVVKTGQAGSQIGLHLQVPAGYELAPGATLPTSYTFGDGLTQTLYIKLVRQPKPDKPNHHGQSTTNPNHSGNGAGSNGTGITSGNIANNQEVNRYADQSARLNDNHKKSQLPQTGNDAHNKGTVVGLAFAALAGTLGFAGRRRRDKSEQ